MKSGKLYWLAALAAFSLSARITDESALRDRIQSTYHVPKPLPALHAQSHGRFEPEPGIIAEKISYETEFGTIVPAIVYRPKVETAERRPALIVVNGHGGDKYSWYSFYTGILYARAGAVVLTYDPVGEGERNRERKSGTRQHDRNIPPDEMARRMAGLMMTDVMQAVSWLSRRADVDPKRIAAVGYSMGSFVLGVTCAVETRLHACVLVGGGNLDGPGGYWDSSAKKMCQSIPYQSLLFLGDRPAVLYALQASRGPALIYNGRNDEVVQITTHGDDFFSDLRTRAIAQHGGATNVFDYGFHPDGSHRPYFVTKPVALWLNHHLHFPNWTAAEIERMPETHISEWGKTNGVFVDKSYSSEQREGGTMALGKDVPGIAREKLNVFGDADWQANKDRLVMETWVEKAKANLNER